MCWGLGQDVAKEMRIGDWWGDTKVLEVIWNLPGLLEAVVASGRVNYIPLIFSNFIKI